jgi:hypothetical protein
MPNSKSAMLYSLSALASYGHANVFLTRRWQMLGALESLNGMLLFGLTTAFLFAMIQELLSSQEYTDVAWKPPLALIAICCSRFRICLPAAKRVALGAGTCWPPGPPIPLTARWPSR